MSAVLEAVETPQEAARALFKREIANGWNPAGLWPYEDADGRALFYKVRLDPPGDEKKLIRPMHLNGEHWALGLPPAPAPGWPLYRLREVLASDAVVYICEGEKAADALHELGVVATTSGGASSARGADWTSLRGRRVRLWPDNDEAGRKYAADVTKCLHALGCTVRQIAADVVVSLPPKGDCVDWLKAHPDATAKDVMALPTADAPQPKAAEWPQLVPLDAPNLPNIDLACLPGWASDFARALSAETETPPELAAGMILAACSTAAARRVRVMVKPNYFEPCNIWALVALPPGNRKSSVQEAAAAPLLEWQDEQAHSMEAEIKRATSEQKTELARADVLRKQAAKGKNPIKADAIGKEVADIEANLTPIPRPTQLWTSDATPENLGTRLADNGECMAWLSSEGGIFDLLGGRYSKGIPNLDLVLKAHSGDAERVDRGSRPPVYLRHPCLTIGLSPQPDVLRGLAAKPGFHGRGLLARFLYLLPPSPLGYRPLNGPPMPEGLRTAYAAGIRAMLEWQPSTDKNGNDFPHVLKLSGEAFSEWHAFAQAIEVKMRPGEELEHATGWAGKAPGAAARIAGILHAIQHAHGTPWDTPIAKETMDAALSIMAVVTRHSVAAQDMMGADATLADARILWHWIERNHRERFTVREAFNALRGTFPRVAKLEEALDALQERDYIEIIEPERSGRGRPPSPVVQVRPDIVGTWQ